MILKIAERPKIQIISKKSKKAQAITNIVTNEVSNHQDCEIIQEQMKKIQNLNNYIQKQL